MLVFVSFYAFDSITNSFSVSMFLAKLVLGNTDYCSQMQSELNKI